MREQSIVRAVRTVVSREVDDGILSERKQRIPAATSAGAVVLYFARMAARAGRPPKATACVRLLSVDA